MLEYVKKRVCTCGWTDFRATPQTLQHFSSDISHLNSINGIHSVEQPQRQTLPAAAALPQQTPEEKAAENKKKAEQLRAKLLAQRQNTPRQNTPARVASSHSQTPPKPVQRTETPARPAPTPSAALSKTPNKMATGLPQPGKRAPPSTAAEPSTKMSASLEALLEQGKALADKKTAELAAATIASAKSAPSSRTSGGPAKQNDTVEQEEAQSCSRPARQQQKQQQELPEQPASKRPTNLSDTYYADLPAWLEMTGYHDVDFRTAKLRTHKERKALEEEAARINERLEKLRQTEQEEMQQMRMATPMSVRNMAPPPLPSTLPVEKVEKSAIARTNGVKRGRSPADTASVKIARRREESGGFRIRGANDSPTEARPPSRRAASPVSPGLERRISYPDIRRRPIDDRTGTRSRDPSLERRQSYYRRDGEPPSRYDRYDPRDAPRDPPSRLNYSSTNNGPRTARPPPPSYRGSAPLDLRKGGQFSRPL